jgi:hypothetical protein
MSSRVPVDQCTVLRLDHSLARTLSPDDQLKQCVDHLENPEVLVCEMVQAAQVVEQLLEASEVSPSPTADVGDVTDFLLLEHFYRDREVKVVSPDTRLFACLASNVEPLPSFAPESETDGLDYVGLMHGGEGVGVLGCVQSDCDPTPYLLLLRSLCGFVELSLALRSHRHRCSVLAEALGDRASFDLHLVLYEPVDPRDSLLQLTRDLAESVKHVIQNSEEMPLRLRDIACLRMDPVEFLGELDLEWAV